MSQGLVDFFQCNTMRVKRRLKSLCRKWFGEEIFFNSFLLQCVFGYRVNGRHILDVLQNASVEYSFDSVIGHSLFYGGSFEASEINFIGQLLKNIDGAPVVLDVGANIGIHSIAWATLCQNAKIYAFEPAQETAEVLERNIVNNALADRVFVVQKAVSDAVGNAQFYNCDDNAFSSLKDTHRKEVISSVAVPTITIDDFIYKNNLKKVSFIKIDVEGFETEVIRGAIRTLRTFSPDLFVEIYGGECSNPNPEETIGLITSLGYQAYVFINDKIVRFERHLDNYYNYYFTKKS